MKRVGFGETVRCIFRAGHAGYQHVRCSEMSHDDFTHYAAEARALRYKHVRPIFATNSIKIVRASRQPRRVPYIWIDPPWRLWKGGKVVELSSSYPDPHRVFHWHTERHWIEGVRSFQEDRPKLLSVSYRSNRRGTYFKLSRRWCIEVLDSVESPDPDEDCYDDWYASAT